MPKRTDSNQKSIVAALRKHGCTVQTLHEVGDGCPDLLCGIDGMNILLECKDGTKPPSKRKLTPEQVARHGKWYGQVDVVTSPVEAIRAVNRHTYEI